MTGFYDFLEETYYGKAMTLSIFCASTGGHEKAAQSWRENTSRPWQITVDATVDSLGAGYIQKLEKSYRETSGDVIAYFHNDLYIHTPDWDKIVLKEFENPNVAVAGFFGALCHGRDDIYKAPFDFRQLVRAGCISNLVDAEVHGAR